MADKAAIGIAGEKAAVAYLRKNGFLIRDLNWRAGRYEIDIIAEKWGIVHFVEVKSRATNGWSRPEDAMTQDKFRALSRAAAAYLGINAVREEHQFDLIAVEMEGEVASEIRYIENAMQSSW